MGCSQETACAKYREKIMNIWIHSDSISRIRYFIVVCKYIRKYYFFSGGKVCVTFHNQTYVVDIHTNRLNDNSLTIKAPTKMHLKWRSILTDFKYAKLTTLHFFQKADECYDYVTMSQFHQQTLKFYCTAKSDDITASSKFRPLEPFLSRGDFKPSNERVQTVKRQISIQAVSQTCQTI